MTHMPSYTYDTHVSPHQKAFLYLSIARPLVARGSFGCPSGCCFCVVVLVVLVLRAGAMERML